MASGALAALNDLPLTEVLDADPRPAFVLDLKADAHLSTKTTSIQPVYCNPALRQHEQLLDALFGKGAEGLAGAEDSPTFVQFKSWATNLISHDSSGENLSPEVLYGSIRWTGSTIRQRWRLISGSRPWPTADHSPGPPVGDPQDDAEVEYGRKRRKQDKAMRESQDGREGDIRVTEPAETSQAILSTTGRLSTAAAALVPADLHALYTRAPPKAFLLSSNEADVSSTPGSVPLSAIEKIVTDWTAPEPKGVLSPHLQVARSINWAKTPLGPMEQWSPEFRQVANLCMNNPHPAALFWGSELTVLYNDAYSREVAGPKHPALMGSSFSGQFREIWEYTRPVFAECARTGISVRRDNDYFAFDRDGLLEETFFSWSFTPLYGGSPQILGFYNAPFETTQHVLWQRRMQIINKVGEHTSQAKKVKQFWKCVLGGFQDNHFDVPFAILYSVGDIEDDEQSSGSPHSTTANRCCHLVTTIAVPAGHAAAPQHLDLKRGNEGFVPVFRDVLRTTDPIVLHDKDGSLPKSLLEGIQSRGFGDPCRDVIVFPVRPTNGETVMGFLVLGGNPRRPYDTEYKAFTSLLNRQLSTSLASTILYEDEVRRSRDVAETAALERERLTRQLNLQANRLQRMTELSPLGLFLITPDGILREANDRFYEMTCLPKDDQYEMSWMDFIAENSVQHMEAGWHGLVLGDHLPWAGEVQVKKRQHKHADRHGESIDCWVMFNAHCEFEAEGPLRSIMGSITDISHLKWAQGLQNRQLREAEETRRRQNEFIDITSHEMRNPLSAILQCADDIASALGSSITIDAAPSQCIIDSCVEATQTIALCVQHQKTIVDDILTVSKLDSNLLLLTPTVAQPKAILKRAVKMFDSELHAKDIEVAFAAHPSYDELGVDWVTIDPSRVLQVLINLMTNAIKFTATSDNRLITVAVGASLTPPDGKYIPGFQFVDAGINNTGVTDSEEWGSGEVLYVKFKVKDTGCGLTRETKQILFQRFKQATPRTHAQYGGSGLGLFISKRLAELHGGQIGVASEAGKGSLFAFFVEARRAGPPAGDERLGTLPRDTEGRGDTSLGYRDAARDEKAASSGGPSAVTPAKATPAFDPKDIHVLVVEDNQVNQKVLVNQLKKLGFAVSTANDGVEALAFLAQTHFQKEGGADLSIILMDLEMPNMGGLTCVRRIRSMEEAGTFVARVPVIAVTANVRDEHVAAVRESGMDDMISKPFRIPELLAKIRTLLDGR